MFSGRERRVPVKMVSSRSMLFPLHIAEEIQECREHLLVACEVRQSGIRNAGRGTFLLETASTGQMQDIAEGGR